MIGLIVGVLVIGALFGLVFSKRGEEGEGALRGAKKAGGCLIAIVILAIIAVVAIVVLGVAGY